MKVNGLANGYIRQLIRLPKGSTIEGVTLMGGAPKTCPWTALRGGVIKFGTSEERANKPIHIKADNLVVPTGWVLMDSEAFQHTKYVLNKGGVFPYRRYDDINHEPMYLLHSGWVHPDQLFLPQGRFTNSFYLAEAQGFLDLPEGGKVLMLREKFIAGQVALTPEIKMILVLLLNGGEVLLKEQQ